MDTPTVIPGGIISPVSPETDPLLEIINELFAAAIGLCPFDWLDRRILEAQGAFIVLWPSISAKINAQFAVLPDRLFDVFDAALSAAWVAATGHPAAQFALGIARGALKMLWNQLFPKAKAALAAKGIAVVG